MTTDIDALLRQRDELKKRDPEAILLFRVDDETGDYYAAFGEDVAELLSLLQPTEGVNYVRSGPTGRLMVAPAALESVLARIVAAGKRAAVCEQVEENPGRKLVDALNADAPNGLVLHGALQAALIAAGNDVARRVEGPAPAGAEVERIVAEGEAERTCPRCGECDSDAPHHWMEDDGTLTGFGCKHCEATAVECMACDGTGRGGVYEDSFGDEVACGECDGLGLVEVVAITLAEVERLRADAAAAPKLLAACKLAIEALGRQTKFYRDDGVLARVVLDLEAAVAEAEKGA